MHLTRGTGAGVVADLVRVVRDHGGARIVFVGDLFDMSAESPAPEHARDVLGAHPELREALGRHVDAGGSVWLVAGNHDAEVGVPGFASELADALSLRGEARERLRATPWFFRDGGLHLEHGHRFDPDNAPEHPLVVGAPSLGVHFVASFIASTGAHAYLNANDRTPLELFLNAFRWYGRRGPYVVWRFFHTAATSLLRSGPFYRAKDEGARGASVEGAFAEAHDVDSGLVSKLRELGVTPTLASTPRTFLRLYLDRVIATVGIGSGVVTAATGAPVLGAAVAGGFAAAMASSWAFGRNRYGGNVATALADGAQAVAETSGAHLVVFGHTHREHESTNYANTGSFAFPRRSESGRPFLEIEGDRALPRAVRRRFVAPR